MVFAYRRDDWLVLMFLLWSHSPHKSRHGHNHHHEEGGSNQSNDDVRVLDQILHVRFAVGIWRN